MLSITKYCPEGRQIAFYNEAGLDQGPLKYEQPLAKLCRDVSRRFRGATVYAVVFQRRGEEPERWVKAYIDYTEQQAPVLAVIAQQLAQDARALAGYSVEYDTDDSCLHVGFWLRGGYSTEELRQRRRLWRRLP